ncbi:MAG: porin [Pseudomonadota bacterium]
MKKILLSTALVVATAGVAAAEVSLSGSGRFGLAYNGGAAAGTEKTTISYRLRVNVDASVESESGVTFGGRIRMQNTEGSGGAALSAAQVFAKYNGMTLQVGNVDTAYDSVALMYDPEMGYIGSSFGTPYAAGGDYASFSSGPYTTTPDRVGIFFSYAIESFNVRVSAVDPDQTVSSDALFATNDEVEASISADYTTGQFTVAAAAAQNASFIDGNDVYFLGAAYKFSDAGTVGLSFMDNGDTNGAPAGDNGKTVVLYGNYTFGATTLRAYVSSNDGTLAGGGDFGANSSTAYGLGADYDLGGATLAGAVQRGYDEETVADVGVKFSF